MKYCQTLLVAACLMIVGCSSAAEDSFEKIVARVDYYFAGQPLLLTSAKITKDVEQAYAYYALKIDKFNLSYDVNKAYSLVSPYNAFINLSCEVANNAKSGDQILDISEIKVASEIYNAEATGFSTTSLALANNNFSSDRKSVTFILRYAYQDNHWTYEGMTVGGTSESLIDDLESFSQNKPFREAVGMEG